MVLITLNYLSCIKYNYKYVIFMPKRSSALPRHTNGISFTTNAAGTQFSLPGAVEQFQHWHTEPSTIPVTEHPSGLSFTPIANGVDLSPHGTTEEASPPSAKITAPETEYGNDQILATLLGVPLDKQIVFDHKMIGELNTERQQDDFPNRDVSDDSAPIMLATTHSFEESTETLPSHQISQDVIKYPLLEVPFSPHSESPATEIKSSWFARRCSQMQGVIKDIFSSHNQVKTTDFKSNFGAVTRHGVKPITIEDEILSTIHEEDNETDAGSVEESSDSPAIVTPAQKHDTPPMTTFASDPELTNSSTSFSAINHSLRSTMSVSDLRAIDREYQDNGFTKSHQFKIEDYQELTSIAQYLGVSDPSDLEYLLGNIALSNKFSETLSD